jgi:adenosine 3'-phospho 5'-phosphosulfate transporter B2
MYSELRPVAPIQNYAGVSLSNVLSTTCQCVAVDRFGVDREVWMTLVGLWHCPFLTHFSPHFHRYEALKYVSFAVQTLGKCAKVSAWRAVARPAAAGSLLLVTPLTQHSNQPPTTTLNPPPHPPQPQMFPVMLWGFLMLRKRYGLKDVGLAVAITGGCFVFFTLGPTTSRWAGRLVWAFGGEKPLVSWWSLCTASVSLIPPAPASIGISPSSPPHTHTEKRVAKGAGSSLYGVALMAGYLVADGYTSTFQQAMFKGHQMSTYNQVGRPLTHCHTLLLIHLAAMGILLQPP